MGQYLSFTAARPEVPIITMLRRENGRIRAAIVGDNNGQPSGSFTVDVIAATELHPKVQVLVGCPYGMMGNREGDLIKGRQHTIQEICDNEIVYPGMAEIVLQFVDADKGDVTEHQFDADAGYMYGCTRYCEGHRASDEINIQAIRAEITRLKVYFAAKVAMLQQRRPCRTKHLLAVAEHIRLRGKPGEDDTRYLKTDVYADPSEAVLAITSTDFDGANVFGVAPEDVPAVLRSCIVQLLQVTIGGAPLLVPESNTNGHGFGIATLLVSAVPLTINDLAE